VDVFKPVFKGRGEIFLPARFRSLEGSVFTASDDLKRPHVMLIFKLVFRTVTMDFPASATLGERLRAYARFRAEEAAAPFAESSKRKRDGLYRRRQAAYGFSGYVSRQQQRTENKTDTEKPSAPEKRSSVLMRIFEGDGPLQGRNTQSIKRSFVRWVYFALNRRGLDLSVFRRHVHFLLSHFSLFLVCSNRDVSRPCRYPSGKDHQR